jgi:hypothetical protein
MKLNNKIKPVLGDEDFPTKRAFVFVNGEKIPMSQTEFITIEEDIHGRDLMTFSYKGKEYHSHITTN